MVFGCANKQEANKDEIDEKKKKGPLWLCFQKLVSKNCFKSREQNDNLYT